MKKAVDYIVETKAFECFTEPEISTTNEKKVHKQKIWLILTIIKKGENT